MGLLGTVVPVKRNSDNHVVYQFIPFFGFFCKSEAEVVYDGVYKSAKFWTTKLLDLEFNVKYISQDHCRAAANAAMQNFPGNLLILRFVLECMRKYFILPFFCLGNIFIFTTMR